MHTPGRGEGALRSGRFSLAGASYFLTLCTEARMAGLSRELVAAAIRAEMDAMERDRRWVVRAAVIMPDHVHALVRVGATVPLHRCVARLKSRTRAALQQHELSWQANFYEHRLRPEDPTESVLRYMYLNPYRAGIAPLGDGYRWFWLGEGARWFAPLADDGSPFADWMR